MNNRSNILRKTLILSAIILFTAFQLCNNAAYAADSLKNLDPAKIKSFNKMREAVSVIERSQKETLADFNLQKLALTKSGECISALVAIRAKSLAAARNKEEKELFLKLREILKQILTANEKIITDFQDNSLDNLKDPGSFFKSSQWQEPQYLISLSSYWMGWNGYYTSMLIEEDDPMFNTLLKESIKGFSRSFIDFQEETVIVRSLFGRALCYGKLKDYDKAIQDLKTVKKKIARDDPLLIRCVYEEIRMVYEKGDYKEAIRALNDVKEDFPKGKIPEEIRKNLDKLNSRALIALMEKKGKGKPENIPASSGKNPNRMFEDVKKLATSPTGMSELYRYAQENSGRLERLSYAQLGPVASMALGDMMFEKKEYDRALGYYLPIITDSPSFMADRMDGVWFRTAYIYCIKQQYVDSIYYLEQFYKKFPDSDILSQAVSLYYAAAARHYNTDKSQKSYNTLMDSVNLYIKKCSGDCPEMGEAHFKMGRRYQKEGKIREAADEFSKVDEDSPNYAIAKMHLLKYYVDELESFEKKELLNSDQATKIYQKGAFVISAYKKWAKEGINSDYKKDIEPHMIILESKLSLYGPQTDIIRNLHNLKDFEKRCPGKKKMFSEVFKLRMVLLQHLGMVTEGEAEIKRFLGHRPINSGPHAILKNMAAEFENMGRLHREGKHETETRQCMDFAMITYAALSRISCNSPESEKYCDMAQLKMAGIYADLNQPDRAEAVYKEILNRNSRSADAIYNLGLLYEKTEQWENALNIWRKFSDGVKKGTSPWFESRYKTAYALSRLGDNAKACEILNITLVLHSDLGSDELKAKYLSLKAKICKGEPS